MKNFSQPIWLSSTGKPLTCREKIKVLNENLSEIQELAQEALEDAIIMGADEEQFFKVLENIFLSIKNPYKK
tara:strand:+ start:463 stop:678 length:216 start_codon:yes stop_codon:yes gene_type:complete